MTDKRVAGEAPKRSLAEATCEEICRLRYGSYGRRNFCIMTDGYTVWLSEQKVGKPVRQQFAISRRMFNRLVAEYQKPKPLARVR